MIDHCRIGSLEKNLLNKLRDNRDHCRIGSLEIIFLRPLGQPSDHCRIGSLENSYVQPDPFDDGSLPHRQLRKLAGALN